MAEDKKSFVVYTDIKDTLDELTDEQVAKLFRGMVDYQLTGEDPDFTGTLKFAFIPIRQQMDRNNAKWEHKKAVRAESGRKGGIASGEARRAKANNEANEANASDKFTDNFINEANEANEAVTVTGTVTVNGTGNVTVSDSGSDVAALSSSLISYLNEQSGGNYKPTEQIANRIGELLAAGYTEADFTKVIDTKVAEWLGDPKMQGYLRPRTLFGNKFEEYVSGPIPIEAKEKIEQQEAVERLQKQRSDKEEILESIASQIGALRDAPGGLKEHRVELRDLRDQQAIVEDSIGVINKKLERLGVAT